MHFDIPECRRCCVCVPLRHGILIFGYLNLIFCLCVLSLEVFEDIRYGLSGLSSTSVFLYRGVTLYTRMWFTYFIYSLEVIFNIVLLVGAHRKDTRVMRVYYYFGIITTLAVFLTYLVTRRYNLGQDWMYDPLEFSLALSGIFIQCYLLLLIRQELNKLKYLGGPVRYVNHLAEVVVEPSPPGEENRQEHIY